MQRVPLRRIALLVLAAGAALAAVVAVGLRSARTSTAQPGATPLVAPRSARTPNLSLGVLTAVAPPGVVGTTWARAARDGRVRLSELRGHPVVLNFWASWCDPCRREAPLLESAWRRESGDVLFLGVNQNDTRSDALGFLRRFAITYPSLREDGDTTAIRWGVRGFPVTFFIATDGHVVAQSIGRLRAAQLRDGLAAARTGRLVDR